MVSEVEMLDAEGEVADSSCAGSISEKVVTLVPTRRPR